MKKRERDIEQEILHHLNLREGTLAWKYDPSPAFDPVLGARLNRGRFVLKGASDIMGVDFRGFFAIEVKTDEGRPNTEQIAFLRRVRKLGARAGIARNLEDALRILEGRDLFHDESGDSGKG